MSTNEAMFIMAPSSNSGHIIKLVSSKCPSLVSAELDLFAPWLRDVFLVDVDV